jgi:hypothetical protein
MTGWDCEFWTKSLEPIENKGRNLAGDPTPGVFAQRVWKVLKTKDRRLCKILSRKLTAQVMHHEILKPDPFPQRP